MADQHSQPAGLKAPDRPARKPAAYKLAFALGGGGARGALQVGALRALLEAGYQPDLLVGTSIGAVNASFLAVRGVNLESIPELERAWHDAAQAQLLPSNYLRLALRSLLYRGTNGAYQRMRQFYIEHGLQPHMRFGEVTGVRLVLVASDLNRGCPVLYGKDPQDVILDGLLASTALPPWVLPMEADGRLLVDGGVASALPVEPALRLGAREIIALDLIDVHGISPETYPMAAMFGKLIYSIEQRNATLEIALAEARRVPVRHIRLNCDEHIPVWDFIHTEALITRGYELAQQAIAAWQPPQRSWWQRWRGKNCQA
jgi:NTE family protein